MVGAIIQARMGSTRFPEKILKKLNDKTILEHIYNRVNCSKVEKVVIATTINSIDDCVEYVNSHLDIGTFVMCFDGEEGLFDCQAIAYGAEQDGKAQAHNLFSTLRQFDELGAKIVYVRCPNVTGVSLAVYNRLIRSAGFRIIDVKK